jgi:hypothetical protein
MESATSLNCAYRSPFASPVVGIASDAIRLTYTAKEASYHCSSEHQIEYVEEYNIIENQFQSWMRAIEIFVTRKMRDERE